MVREGEEWVKGISEEQLCVFGSEGRKIVDRGYRERGDYLVRENIRDLV